MVLIHSLKIANSQENNKQNKNLISAVFEKTIYFTVHLLQPQIIKKMLYEIYTNYCI